MDAAAEQLAARLAALEARLAALEAAATASPDDAAPVAPGERYLGERYLGVEDEWIPDSCAEKKELGDKKRTSLEFVEGVDGVLQLAGFDKSASDGKLSETVKKEGEDPKHFVPVKHVEEGETTLEWMENDIIGIPPDTAAPEADTKSISMLAPAEGAPYLALYGFADGAPGDELLLETDESSSDGSVTLPAGYLVPVRYASTKALEWKRIKIPVPGAGLPDGFEVVSSIDGFAYASGNLTLTYSTRAYDAESKTWSAPEAESLSVPVDSCGDS